MDMLLKMKKLCFILLLFFLCGNLISGAFAEEVSFSDLALDHWARREIRFLVEEGIVRGYPDGTFRPENQVTRAEFAKLVLLSSLNRKASYFPSVPTFPDVPSSHWAFGYVEACAKLGWIAGYPDGKFEPENSVSKAEALKIIVLARELPLSVHAKDAFLDCDEEDWFFSFVQTALSFNILRISDPGLIEEVSNPVGAYSREILGYLLFPDLPATRAQAAVLLYRLIFTP